MSVLAPHPLPRHLKLALIFKFPSCLAGKTLSQTHAKTAAWSGITRLWQGLFQRTVVLTRGTDYICSTHTHPIQEHWLPLFTPHWRGIFIWQGSTLRNLSRDGKYVKGMWLREGLEGLETGTQIMQRLVCSVILEKELFPAQNSESVRNPTQISKCFFLKSFKHLQKNGMRNYHVPITHLQQWSNYGQLCSLYLPTSTQSSTWVFHWNNLDLISCVIIQYISLRTL